jgi:hypothetical protein
MVLSVYPTGVPVVKRQRHAPGSVTAGCFEVAVPPDGGQEHLGAAGEEPESA